MKTFTSLIVTINECWMKKLLNTLAVVCVLTGSTFAQTAELQQTSPDASRHPLFVRFSDVKWEKTCPNLGDRSNERAILHVDPKTQATQLLIRVPPNRHIPRHWHTANETHTVISGTFVFECDGKREELGPGGFNYMPSKMIHQAWTKEEGGLVFITVDGVWDANVVDGPPCAPETQ